MRLHTKKTMHWAGIACILAALALGGLTGCHSHYVQANITNNSGTAISLLELDYPSASFGVDSLASDAVYHYRFKILGSGPTKLLWTDAQHHDHSVTGPSLQEGQEGTLTVTITPTAATWQTNLSMQ
jgi:hypothetical protein